MTKGISDPNDQNPTITVVIPAYKVKSQILDVIDSIGSEVQKIIVIDDACPQKSGEEVISKCKDDRVEVIFHQTNIGVGGAVKTGYKRALKLGSGIVVKIDGDGQMDTSRIGDLVSSIRNGSADYAKGNRFFDVETVRAMPKLRIMGNLGLSFLTKLSSGYWRIFDPNNGFTAINIKKLKSIPLDKIDNGYFFESDMLFRLNLADAIVKDVPMPAIYQDEISNLKVKRVVLEFPIKHIRNFSKRLIYSYYLRDFNLASAELPLGVGCLLFASVLGIDSWLRGIANGIPTNPGTLILFSVTFLSGVQLILAFFSYDMQNAHKH
jgi:glycosyltransferase involved in cell wall biosynthesis